MTRFPEPTPAPGGAAVFADSHLGQVEGDADDLLASLESVRQRGFSAAVLLGDIFHYFIGNSCLTLSEEETQPIRKIILQ